MTPSDATPLGKHRPKFSIGQVVEFCNGHQWDGWLGRIFNIKPEYYKSLPVYDLELIGYQGQDCPWCHAGEEYIRRHVEDVGNVEEWLTSST